MYVCEMTIIIVYCTGAFTAKDFPFFQTRFIYKGIEHAVDSVVILHNS